MTKAAQVQAHLELGLPITQRVAAEKYNAWRLSSIISRLRKRGMHIRTEEIPTADNIAKYASYSLVNE